MHQLILIGSFLPLCWFAMMGVHELGHVVAAWLTGSTVTQVVLHPLAISRTDVGPNLSPLAVVWAGPLLGVLMPLVLYGLFHVAKLPGVYLARFFAGFCLIANGAYISIGSFAKIGDTGEMIDHGSPIGLLWAFGLLSIPSGFVLWNGLGPSFGLGDADGKVETGAAYVSLVMLITMFVAMISLSPMR
ncbi:MAG: hypothetical protein COA78_01935 [Blastopirellula sp.]|nr:MAG: hypothetical protein COA78_01935 [Blastopirellula sp.]